MTNRETTAKRMLNVKELCQYTGLGRNRAAEFGKSVGAEKHIGRRCLYDVVIIDRALDQIKA